MKLRCVSLEIVLFKSKEVRQQQKTGGGKKKREDTTSRSSQRGITVSRSALAAAWAAVVCWLAQWENTQSWLLWCWVGLPRHGQSLTCTHVSETQGGSFIQHILCRQRRAGSVFYLFFVFFACVCKKKKSNVWHQAHILQVRCDISGPMSISATAATGEVRAERTLGVIVFLRSSHSRSSILSSSSNSICTSQPVLFLLKQEQILFLSDL